MSKIAFSVDKIVETNNGVLEIPSSTVSLLKTLQRKSHKLYYLADRSTMPACRDALGVVRLLLSSDISYDGVVSLPSDKGFDYWLKCWKIEYFYNDDESIEEFCSKL